MLFFFFLVCPCFSYCDYHICGIWIKIASQLCFHKILDSSKYWLYFLAESWYLLLTLPDNQTIMLDKPREEVKPLCIFSHWNSRGGGGQWLSYGLCPLDTHHLETLDKREEMHFEVLNYNLHGKWKSMKDKIKAFDFGQILTVTN